VRLPPAGTGAAEADVSVVVSGVGDGAAVEHPLRMSAAATAVAAVCEYLTERSMGSLSKVGPVPVCGWPGMANENDGNAAPGLLACSYLSVTAASAFRYKANFWIIRISPMIRLNVVQASHVASGTDAT
jgi:hypothetical protein